MIPSLKTLLRERPALSALAAGIVFSIAWWFPSTGFSAVLGWLGAFCLVAFSRSPKARYRDALLLGCVLYCLGFYWLLFTIKDFGGYGFLGAAAVFTLFVVLSSNQQLIFFFVRRNLPTSLDRWGLLTALAWISSEYVSVRIFPWSLGHPQVAFSIYAQSADLLGVSVIGFVQLWLIEALWISLEQKKLRWARTVPILLFAAALAYGWLRLQQFRSPAGPEISVALVQANISTAEKRNIKFFVRNRERYEELSKTVAEAGTIIIWPETVITDFIYDGVTEVAEDPRLPFFGRDVGLLVGLLTFRTPTELYNSALAVLPSGKVHPPYHKRILMPFGEFMPFARTFPWLRQMNPTAGDFTAGTSTSVFEYRFGESSAARLSPLICYEDIVPALARDATVQGAQLLVNMTNDAWFGKSVAPRQHHLIASFRAIENRRFLLRSTNSGLTAIVDPTGQTVAELPGFSDGIIQYRVTLLDYLTPYTKWFGDSPWWLLSILCACMSVARALKQSICRRKQNV